jgi:hypothetical protein
VRIRLQKTAGHNRLNNANEIGTPIGAKLGNTSFMSFLSEQIKQIGPIKISCWQRSVKEIRFDYTKKEISYALENDNYVKSKVIRSE